MKNFCDSTNNLHYFEFKDWEYIYDERNNPRTTKGIWWHPDVYTYFDINDSSNWRIPNKQLEEDLWNIFEKKYSEILKDILENISSLSFTFTPENKKLILEIIEFSIWKILFHKLWENKGTKNTKEELDLLNSITNYILSNALSSFFDALLEDKRIWKIIYSQEDVFFIWDSIFHIRPNWRNGEEYNNNLLEFLSNPWSNIFFPLSKNIALVIESLHPDTKVDDEFLRKNIVIISAWWILGNTYREQWVSWVYSETMEGTALYRIPALLI